VLIYYDANRENYRFPMRFTIAALLLPALAGCASQMPNEAKLAEAQATYNNQDDNLCRSRGATVGTDPYVECRRALAQEHIDAAAAQEAQRQAAASPPTTQQSNQQPLQR
jgi:hypothetical protein